jgi:hypothetical protein
LQWRLTSRAYPFSGKVGYVRKVSSKRKQSENPSSFLVNNRFNIESIFKGCPKRNLD